LDGKLLGLAGDGINQNAVMLMDKLDPNRLAGAKKVLQQMRGGLDASGKVVSSGISKGTPLAVGLDAIMELTDDSEPFSKNAFDAVGSGVGTLGGIKLGASLGALGGPAAPITVPLGAILGAIALSEVGQKATGGIYNIVNPDGVQNYKIKKIRKAGELEAVKAEVLREIERQDMLAQIEMRQKLKDIDDQNRLITGGF
tara:strand:- start:260 stop:856 length:597 start_codon:yes stop_codon:yes gene_type:complete